MTALTLLKYLWALPTSVIGLVFAAFARPLGARVRLHEGVVEVTLAPHPGSRLRPTRWLPFEAITFGHVVIARTAHEQAHLRAHERVHVAQYERWGPLLLLAYPAESLLQLLRGRRPYLDNRFEAQARRGSLGEASSA
jgi:hypothetical protein